MKICQNFMVANFFLTFVGDKSLWGELKIYGGVIFITTLSLFHFFRNSQHQEKWSISFKNLVTKCECISCYLLISSNLLKKSCRKILCLLWQIIWKKCSISCIFQAIVVIVVIKNPRKISVKKFSFRKEFSGTLCRYIYLQF